jgi:protein-disulfide isomerase
MAVLLAVLSSSAVASPARDAWQEEILLQLSELRKTQGELEQQVAELRVAADKSRAAGGARKARSLDLTNVSLPALGAATASLAIVEFSDFQCPYCRRHQQGALAELLAKYVESGKARYYFVDFPLDSHTQALPAAIAATCAYAQGAFWKMHDGLFENQAHLGADLYERLAGELRLDMAQFESCLSDSRMKRQVRARVALGNAAGVQGTPAFVVGRLQHGVLTDFRSLGGARPFEEFALVLDQLLEAPASDR